MKLSHDELDFTFIGQMLEWSGDEASIPDGWAIANGENGTDDMRARFIGNSAESTDVVIYDGELPFSSSYFIQKIA